MKKILLIGASTLLLAMTGCATLSSLFGATPSAPSKVEQALYVIQTNYVDQVVTTTNTITFAEAHIVQVTNVNNEVVTQTNVQTVIDHQLVLQTNQVAVYTQTTAPATVATVQGIGAATNAVAPGVGTMISTIGLGLLAFWGHLRSWKRGTTANVVTQEVEALREFIQSLPNGTKYDAVITAWLQSHQVESGVATQVLAILDKSTDNTEAKKAAESISATLTALGTPVPKQS